MACSTPDNAAAAAPPATARMLGYASGNFGKNLLASTMDVFLMFTLTEYWGISPLAAGLIVMLGLVWDGLCNPLLGRILDRATDRAGLYRRLLVLAAPVVTIPFTIVFLLPTPQPSFIIPWAISLVLVFRTAYATCDVAHNALMMRMTGRQGAATMLSALRYMFSCLGALAVAGSAPAFVDPALAGGHRLIATTACAALAYVATLWLAAASGPAATEPPRIPARPQTPLRVWILRNRPFCALLVFGFAQALTLPVFARSFAYIGKGVIHDPDWTARALTTLALSQLVMLPVWVGASRRASQHGALAAALILVAVGSAVFATGPRGMMAGIALFGAGNAGVQMMIWALLADAIDHGERRTGVRLEAVPVALLLLTLKLGGGIGGALFGQGLALAGWTGTAPLGETGGGQLLAMAWAMPVAGAVIGIAVVVLQSHTGAGRSTVPATRSLPSSVSRSSVG
ncbi:MFS transporter [Sphingomonas sp. CFBP 13706]|uniref:MFS transporter n=1 Tax=Sphingomonas sp. CFBP 13706 TaxID=2775314 RepID=UPI0017822D5E|nr:MFS transporter [Sphingomonas sp. CFBP 13706]MBD8736610.1 MFS transporter [Sphingomonas sp. CFBP 13706]